MKQQLETIETVSVIITLATLILCEFTYRSEELEEGQQIVQMELPPNFVFKKSSKNRTAEVTDKKARILSMLSKSDKKRIKTHNSSNCDHILQSGHWENFVKHGDWSRYNVIDGKLDIKTKARLDGIFYSAQWAKHAQLRHVKN